MRFGALFLVQVLAAPVPRGPSSLWRPTRDDRRGGTFPRLAFSKTAVVSTRYVTGHRSSGARRSYNPLTSAGTGYVLCDPLAPLPRNDESCSSTPAGQRVTIVLARYVPPRRPETLRVSSFSDWRTGHVSGKRVPVVRERRQLAK